MHGNSAHSTRFPINPKLLKKNEGYYFFKKGFPESGVLYTHTHLI